MEPQLKILSEKKLVGMQLKMSFANNRTGELWKGFMPRRKDIQNSLSGDLFSMQVYPSTFDFNSFDVNIEYEKWAAVAVADFETVPAGMTTYLLVPGLYAVFTYKGASNDNRIFQYIFGTWLPASEYVVDNRPHFELLGEKYKNNDPTSEEEIWVPVRPK